MRALMLSAAWLTAALTLPAPAVAATFVELGDAGQSLATANLVNNPALTPSPGPSVRKTTPTCSRCS